MTRQQPLCGMALLSRLGLASGLPGNCFFKVSDPPTHTFFDFFSTCWRGQANLGRALVHPGGVPGCEGWGVGKGTQKEATFAFQHGFLRSQSSDFEAQITTGLSSTLRFMFPDGYYSHLTDKTRQRPRIH